MMNIINCIGCKNFACDDVNKESCNIPDINIKPEDIRIVMISEASSENVEDYFYTGDDSFYMHTTLNAFKEVGLSVSTMKDIFDHGIYMTTAVKCGKTSYAVSPSSPGCSYYFIRFSYWFAEENS